MHYYIWLSTFLETKHFALNFRPWKLLRLHCLFMLTFPCEILSLPSYIHPRWLSLINISEENPLYSASSRLFGGRHVEYFGNTKWEFCMEKYFIFYFSLLRSSNFRYLADAVRTIKFENSLWRILGQKKTGDAVI